MALGGVVGGDAGEGVSAEMAIWVRAGLVCVRVACGTVDVVGLSGMFGYTKFV